MHWFIMLYHDLYHGFIIGLLIFQYLLNSLATFLCRRVLLRLGSLISRGDEIESNGISNGYVAGEWEYIGDINRIGSTDRINMDQQLLQWLTSGREVPWSAYSILFGCCKPKGMSSQDITSMSMTEIYEVYWSLQSSEFCAPKPLWHLVS